MVFKREDVVKEIRAGGKTYRFFDMQQLEGKGFGGFQRLPYTIRILLENLLRNMDGEAVTADHLREVASWRTQYEKPIEIPFHPYRVLMQDFTGVPAIVDLAAMRDAVKDLGGDPALINPLVPVDLVVDHSVQVDFYGTPDCLGKNVALEYERNRERYSLLKWAQKSFDNFRVVPPNSGICHQVNLEHLGRVVADDDKGDLLTAFPDTLVGTDSHTTMINGVGVLGWGVGGIEAEAVALGQPYYMSIPQVIGVRLMGKLKPDVTATDMVLTVTERLRSYGVVEKFVEYFGPGLSDLSVPDRATLANMSPEYGATVGFSPVDGRTIEYLAMTGREERAELTEKYCKAAGLYYTGEDGPEYTDIIEIDLGAVQRSVAGPARPQDRIELPELKTAAAAGWASKKETAEADDGLGNGSVVIAAITSCTNTSNPYVLLGAGLLARKAVEKGLKTPPHVKTSLVPGSRAVVDYLKSAGLDEPLAQLGFHLAGFGCTTCIGNSGPLSPEIEGAIQDRGLHVAAVLSGNRNFEARIHQRVKGNYLMSPILVVAFALAGRIGIDMTAEPLGHGPDGSPVFLADIWPDHEEILKLSAEHVRMDFFKTTYERIFEGDDFWRTLSAPESATFVWDPASTYIKKPPYFDGFSLDPPEIPLVQNARALLLMGDSVTTDHISPAGAIPADYPAGKYLQEKGVSPADFNSYGSRRGNHEVMMRGTFGNIRIRNKLVEGMEGSYTRRMPDGEKMFIYDAAMGYGKEKTSLVVLGGKEYGTGSSRDWAAKGSILLGVRAVIAESFERIHRSNLVGMGVLPLEFMEGESWQTLGLDGSETFSIENAGSIEPQQKLEVTAVAENGRRISFAVKTRLDTAVDVAYFQNGGILQYVLRRMMAQGAA